MKTQKKIVTAVIFLISPLFLQAQINTATGTATAILPNAPTTNTNVGIGTNVPKSKLDVKGNLTIGATYAGINAATANGAIIEGNVGIGTTTPISKLQVNGDLTIGSGTVNANTTKLFINNPVVGPGSTPGRKWALSSGLNGISESNFGIYNWTDSQTAPLFTIADTGNVGIGTSTPTAKLEVNGNINVINASNKIVGFNDAVNYYIGSYPVAGSAGFDIHGYGGIRFGDRTSNSVMQITNGNVGIGITTPVEKLEIAGNAKISSYSPMLILQRDTPTGGFTQGIQTKMQDGTNNWFFGNVQPNRFSVCKGDYTMPLMSVFDTGNVGIATANPDEKLTVKGKIHAEEVRIDLLVPADYVFQKYYTGTSALKSDYVMPTLDEVAQYTKVNNHLPSIPSAEEMKKNGVQLGEMNNLLLQKIEELTLYAIEQEKRLLLLENQIKQLNKDKK
jgi:hypothetical protein